ncbi:MAG: hypothetical protein KVP17_005063 [Porospora cf. gigantea B]|uniref:uncharacterized protein n=1 Tax=Porospora cf. gigantea B TaxID=2853592 RepID=UPI003571D7B5|nr:MAG: hypothetical protein KVP17_005063 [Porospora cf. gigantea B]
MRIEHRLQEKSPLLASGLIFSKQSASRPTTLEYQPELYHYTAKSLMNRFLDNVLTPLGNDEQSHANVLTPLDNVEPLPPVVSLRESTEFHPGISRILEAMRLLLHVSRALAYSHKMDVHHSDLKNAVYVTYEEDGSVYKLKQEPVVNIPTDDVLQLGLLVLERLIGCSIHCEDVKRQLEMELMDQGIMDQLLDGFEDDLLKMPRRTSGSESAPKCDPSQWSSIPSLVALLRRVLQFDDTGRISAAALALEADKVLEMCVVESHVYTNCSLSRASNALASSRIQHTKLCPVDNDIEEFSIVNFDECEI